MAQKGTGGRRVYNLVWAALDVQAAYPIELGRFNTIGVPQPHRAFIVYPAFATSGVHVEDTNDGMVELILAAPVEVPITPEVVNLHLKLQQGLCHKEKRVRSVPLFDGASLDQRIKVKKVKDLPSSSKQSGGFKEGILRTHNTFRGLLSPHAAIYDLLLPNRSPDALAERSAADARAFTDPDAPNMPPPEPDRAPHLASGWEFWAIQFHQSAFANAWSEGLEPGTVVCEEDDLVVRKVLTELNGPKLQGLGGLGTHCFGVGDNGVDFTKASGDAPIAAYHPYCVHAAPEALPGNGKLSKTFNFGHVSDIHINARQGFLRRSPVRVLDVDQDGPLAQLSPELGKRISVYSDNLLSILENMRMRADVDLLLVGGDLVDHAINACPLREFPNPTAQQVWDLVRLGGASRSEHYQAFVDHLTFYSILMDNYRQKDPWPVLALAGNHDAYDEPYGISPRAIDPKHGVRANDGIPADHNLTIYEAALIFGETYGVVEKSFNFTAKLFRWFYTVFTPFSDFDTLLPKQRVVGLSWGDDENFLLGKSGHSISHLPRANRAITEQQLSIAADRLDQSRPTTLMTHFTFVSYKESIPNSNPNGQVHVAPGSDSTDHDFGTFYNRRRELFEVALDTKKMQCVLTGHSHRRAVYFASDEHQGTYSTRLVAWDGPITPASVPELASHVPIIVSDSAGPLPRLNRQGEFEGWGSDRPSGTVVTSTLNGKVSSIVHMAARTKHSKPRLAVAMDYLQWVGNGSLTKANTYPLKFWLETSRTAAAGAVMKVRDPRGSLQIATLPRISLIAQKHRSREWMSLEFHQVGPAAGTGAGANQVEGPRVHEYALQVSERASDHLREWCRSGELHHFMALHLKGSSSLGGIYDDSDPLIYEVVVSGSGFEGGITLISPTETPRFHLRAGRAAAV